MRKSNLNIIQNILFLELRPWLNRATPEAKYRQLYEDIIKTPISFQPLYETVFPKPLTAKRKYYHKLIENDTVEYLNHINAGILTAITINEKRYWVHTALTKVLSQKLRDVNKVIETFSFDLSNLANKSIIDSTIKEDTYIIQYLRLQLLRTYLEIQNLHKEYLKEEPLSFQELNEKYFAESLADSSLKDAAKIQIPTFNKQIISKEPEGEFESKAFDINRDKNKPKNVLGYNEVIKNPSRFSSFEEKLFINGLIDNTYTFQNKHGQIQELAAIYHALIQKNYFHNLKFPGGKPIKDVDIRRFLDHRYNASTQKQFNTWANAPDKLADFLNERYWIDKLPVS